MRWVAVGIHPSVIDKLFALCGSVVAVDRVQLFTLGESAPRETCQGCRMMAAVTRSDVHGPYPPLEMGQCVEKFALAFR
jgi:hypothetical protein